VAHRRESRISVCGEVAGEPALACLLAGMGIRHLSLNVGQAAVVGHYLRTMDLGDLEHATQTALEAKDLQEVRDVIQTIHKKATQADA
jgi:phosphoenolpyruvate-protein kinase (PTS system EI component)